MARSQSIYTAVHSFQVPTLDEKQLELLHDKQPPEHGLGVVAASNRKNTTTSKKGTVSEATRKIIQQLERDLTAGTRPGPHVCILNYTTTTTPNIIIACMQHCALLPQRWNCVRITRAPTSVDNPSAGFT